MVEDSLGNLLIRLRPPKLTSGLAALLAGLAVLIFSAATARAASFTASLDRDTITLGETATLSLKFEGGTPEQLPSSMTVSNLQLVLVGGPSHFDININGNRTSYDTFSYVVTPTQAGQFTIPSLTASVNGKQLSSQPLKLTVTKPVALPAGGGADSQIAFARLLLPRKEIYSGETVIADLQLFYRQDVQLAREPQVTAVPADGFTVGKISGNNQSLTQIGNAIYNVIPAKIALTANKSGALHLGPVTISLVLLVPSNDRQSDSFFDPFGMLRRNVQKPVSVATSALDVQSLPLPSENWPDEFQRRDRQLHPDRHRRADQRSPSAILSPCACRSPATARSRASRCPAQAALERFQNLSAHDQGWRPADQFGFQGNKNIRGNRLAAKRGCA